MPAQRVDTNLNISTTEEIKADNKEFDNDDKYKSSSISNSESEDESIVYHIPETKVKRSTTISDEDVENISKNFSGFTISVKSKGPIQSQSIFRQHESRLPDLQHDHYDNNGRVNNFNGGYLIENNSTFVQDNITDYEASSYLNGGYIVDNLTSVTQDVLEEVLLQLPDLDVFLPNNTPDNSNNAPFDLNALLNPLPVQPTSIDQEFLNGNTDLVHFNDLVSPESIVCGNETVHYEAPSPNYSTNSSTGDDFLQNIEHTHDSYDDDVRVFEDVMSSWSDKTGNKIAVWIRVNVSDVRDLIRELSQRFMSQGNRDDNKILNIYAIINRLMKHRTKKEIIDTRSLLRNLYKTTNNLLWLVAQQKHVGLFNYFIETVQNLEIQITEIQGQEIFLHQLAKCHSVEMVDILTAALERKTRGSCNIAIFNINKTNYLGLTPLETVLTNLSQQQINSERYLTVKKALHVILDAQPDSLSNSLQFAQNLNLPPEICNLFVRNELHYDFTLHSFE